MKILELLKCIYDSTNDSILNINHSMPWTDNQLEKNIISFLKKRIDVNNFRKITTVNDISSVDSDKNINKLIASGLVITVDGPQSVYLVITEVGITLLNLAVSRQINNEADFEACIGEAKTILTNIIARNLLQRCKNVFEDNFSAQEAILTLFILINGGINEHYALKLEKSQTGYLHGDEIVAELNRIYKVLTDRRQTDDYKIRDQKQLRDVIGRNGKNGRIAKSFPNLFNRVSNKIWFDLALKKNPIPEIKKVLAICIDSLADEMETTEVALKLVELVEEYTVYNPLPLFVRKDLFNSEVDWEYYLSLLNAAKEVLSENRKVIETEN